MKKYLGFIVLGLILGFGLISCEVEFNPNDSWKETTSIYGVLDQDADTNFIRIQKCFVGEGNYIEFSKVKDSIYYKQEDLDVRMYAFYEWESSGWDTNKAKEVHVFNYTEFHKDSGSFNFESSPIYFTTKKLYPDFVYYLIVRNLKTGNIATANTKLVADYTVSSPSDSAFGFNVSSIYDYRSIMKCTWNNQVPNSKGVMSQLFQPSIRFNFMENGQPAHITIDFKTTPNIHSVAGKDISYIFFEDDVLNQIKTKILKRGSAIRTFRDDTPSFEIFVFGCAEELKYYIDNNAPILSLAERPIYTNINNGVGIFSSRRTHIKKSYSRRAASLENAIRSSGIGF